MPELKIKAVFFDFMGTCLDWHTSAVSALPSSLPKETKSSLALEWRHDYFSHNAARVANGEGVQDFDETLRVVLDTVLAKPEHADIRGKFDEAAKIKAVEAWHNMRAWPDVPLALSALKSAGYEVYVHANGSTRLQVDLCRSAGLSFDMLFSSELLGVYKPNPEAYLKALRLLRLKAEEVVLVAAHAYDTRGARGVGMRTVYVRRWSDDVGEDFGVVEGENDRVLEDMTNLPEVIAGL